MTFLLILSNKSCLFITAKNVSMRLIVTNFPKIRYHQIIKTKSPTPISMGLGDGYLKQSSFCQIRKQSGG